MEPDNNSPDPEAAAHSHYALRCYAEPRERPHPPHSARGPTEASLAGRAAAAASAALVSLGEQGRAHTDRVVRCDAAQGDAFARERRNRDL